MEDREQKTTPSPESEDSLNTVKNKKGTSWQLPYDLLVLPITEGEADTVQARARNHVVETRDSRDRNRSSEPLAVDNN